MAPLVATVKDTEPVAAPGPHRAHDACIPEVATVRAPLPSRSPVTSTEHAGPVGSGACFARAKQACAREAGLPTLVQRRSEALRGVAIA